MKINEIYKTIGGETVEVIYKTKDLGLGMGRFYCAKTDHVGNTYFVWYYENGRAKSDDYRNDISPNISK